MNRHSIRLIITIGAITCLGERERVCVCERERESIISYGFDECLARKAAFRSASFARSFARALMTSSLN
jgi:hypothetical protein